jgi:hypothetical protein
MEIRAPVKEGTLLHFTAAQWKQAISRIPVGRRLPKQGMFLEAYPIPDGDVLAQPDCVPGPCEICRVRMVPGRDGLIAMDCQGGRFVIACACGRPPSPGGGKRGCRH